MRNDQVREIGELRANAEEGELFALPRARLIGRAHRAPMAAGAPNPIPAYWDAFLSEGRKEPLYALPRLAPALLGLMDHFDPARGTFRYWIGVLCPEGTPAPDGFDSRAIAPCTAYKGRYGEWTGLVIPVCEGWEAAPDWLSELYVDGEPTEGFRPFLPVRRKREQA